MTDQCVLNKVKLTGEAAVSFYEEQFREVSWERDDEILQYIPKLITEEQNERITQLSENKKVRSCMFALSESSASGLDRFTRSFF